jgi:hypothetical protein
MYEMHSPESNTTSALSLLSTEQQFNVGDLFLLDEVFFFEEEVRDFMFSELENQRFFSGQQKTII